MTDDPHVDELEVRRTMEARVRLYYNLTPEYREERREWYRKWLQGEGLRFGTYVSPAPIGHTLCTRCGTVHKTMKYCHYYTKLLKAEMREAAKAVRKGSGGEE